MAPLDSELRGSLEKAIVAAREEAEKAAAVALKTLAVDRAEAFATQTLEQRRLRNALRARARQLGDGNQTTGLPLLVEEVAYEQWHRMLFARFLAENGLLMHPTGVAVTIQDCAELAAEDGASDPWQLAAKYASRMLPGIFRTEDPSVEVPLTPEGRGALEAVLGGIPQAVFLSDDGLGWVYQFWQSKRKKEVSQSGRKIERLDLAVYSQLFTEHYMVRFLLENSLGAWWAARHPKSPLLREFTYLRFNDDGTPAAGTFTGWPERAAQVTVMDPCCGSGHFLVAAFEMLRQMRMEEDGLGEAEAADAVLRDNLFGLEIDPRCVQIAAFALALVAWKAGGYRSLPLPNVACSGVPVNGQLDEWTKLAGEDVNLKHTLERLHHLFKNASDLGSLINPSDVPVRERMFEPDFAKVAAALELALAKERTEDPVAVVFGRAAQGIARAAELLASQYTLIATNVPYLAHGKQGDILKTYCSTSYSDAQADLATVFVDRCHSFVALEGSYAIVAPQSWLSQEKFAKFRTRLLRTQRWDLVARLGPGAFETIGGAVVNVALFVFGQGVPPSNHAVSGIDATLGRTPREKAEAIPKREVLRVLQSDQLVNPDARFSLIGTSRGPSLAAYATSTQGIKTGDDPRFRRFFWEFPVIERHWKLCQTTVEETTPFGGLTTVVFWENGGRDLARLRGHTAWGKVGVAVRQMGEGLPCSLYRGDAFDSNISAVVPRDPQHLPAIWAFLKSEEFRQQIKQIAPSLKVANGEIKKVQFDLSRWQSVAQEMGPLPTPYSNDPTQWLFTGNPVHSTELLQAAVSRLLGYHWPQQDSDGLSALVEQDCILPLAPVAGKEPAAERLRRVLAVAYGAAWSPDLQERLLQHVGYSGMNLEAWLRDGFFEQHCKLFHQRPFIWHIWDGRKDGFSALVNCHELDAAQLDKLIYTYLGDWIRTQRSTCETGAPGADARLVSALELQKKLEAIRDGEPPYDIYVRWKALDQQPIGWNPDLNDGVRLNIRPFVIAGVLRSRVNVSWNKDRGLNPDGTERLNDKHHTVAEKRAARGARA